MRFMMIVKHNGEFSPPPKQLIDALEQLSEVAVKAGTMLGSGGLAPTAKGARVRLSNGQISVTDGPFAETKEIIGGYAQFELPSKEEAVAGALKFIELHQKYWPGWEGETEIRQMMEAEECAAETAGAASSQRAS
jgi:hypothetical protein